ncbi:NIMA (never in mitosis gene a)-related kinase 6 [Enteropsectra breve]|nr:NIMA (never in mitosis gene a)-related kinase 6 [Enteropsectra breve]
MQVIIIMLFMRMDNYKFIEKIGSGTHGTTYLLRSNDEHKYVVCKSVVERHRRHAQKEIELLNRLNHRRVVRLIDGIEVKESVFIILEYANYGTLESMIQYFRNSKAVPGISLAWSVLAQMADALYYIHSRKIVHRDIKPANILINKFSVKGHDYLEFKICDFSLATTYENHSEPFHDGTTVGTPFYMAPEMVSKCKYDATIDIWGMGVVLYELLRLKRPFTGENRNDLFNEILNRNISEEEICMEEGLSEIILSCLKKSSRPTSRMIAKREKVRLNLTMLELKYRESKIEELENKINEYEKREDVLNMRKNKVN